MTMFQVCSTASRMSKVSPLNCSADFTLSQKRASNSESIGIQIHGCLAGLGTGAYLTLSALGLERIILRTDACSSCKWHSLSPEIHNQAERANRFLSAWNKMDNVTCLDEIKAPVERPLWDVKNPPLSRRDLFRMMARQGQVAMARAMENGVTTFKGSAWPRPNEIVVCDVSFARAFIWNICRLERIWFRHVDDLRSLHSLWRMWQSLSDRRTAF